MGFLSAVGSADITGFLSKLGSAINEQYAPGENTLTSLDTVSKDDPERVTSYGKLGSYAAKIDQSASRSYIEDGLIRNTIPRRMQVLTQQPDMTILIKKRMFSSLIDNYRQDYMSDKERLFIRASKRLFQNKMRAINAYEKLSKIERAVEESGVVNSFMFPQVLHAVDALDASGLPNIIDSKTRAVLNTVRKVMAFSKDSPISRWLVEREFSFFSELGEGTGVIELTMATEVSTTVSTSFAAGSASLSIEDPYKLMVITNAEIDKAISDASNLFNNSNFFRVTDDELAKVVSNAKTNLNKLRAQRGAAPISFIVNSDTVLGKKVRVLIHGAVGGASRADKNLPLGVTPAGAASPAPTSAVEVVFNYDPGILGINASIQVDEAFTDQAEHNALSTRPIQLPSQFGSTTLDGGFSIYEKEKTSELKELEKVVVNTFLLLKLKETTDSQAREFNNEMTYVRNKMRLHFANKTIIQPMDVVHVFMTSRSKPDEKFLDGLQGNFNGAGFTFANKLNNVIKGIGDLTSQLKNVASGFGSGGAVDLEKAAIVGADFPGWLWQMLRNDFTRQAAGVHVFAGIVDKAAHSYSGGFYNLRVDVLDHANYFKISQINVKPSVEVFNGVLYDPLTPFDMEFDASSGFITGEAPVPLPENERMLNSSLVKFKNGRFRGSPVSKASYLASDNEIVGGKIRRIFNDPDGFVYKWKEGIGSLTVFGDPHPDSSTRIERSPRLTENAFAGQDVMNVVSLLITGRPYNYVTFLKASIDNQQIFKNFLTNESGAKAYLEGLIDDLRAQNTTWGNFMPFKGMSVNDQASKAILLGQLSAIQSNERINSLLRQRARLFDQLVAQNAEFANDPRLYSIDVNANPPTLQAAPGITSVAGSNASIELRIKIAELDLEIEKSKQDFMNTLEFPNLNNFAGQLRLFGNDISFDSEVTQDSTSVTVTQREADRREFRKKLNSLTLRRLWKVKANEDQNLFIVDDQYDKSYDIQAFERKLAGKMELFKSVYTTPGDQIKTVAEILGLEVFADSQGHIRARPPSYNKMPSSVFHRMFKDRVEKGIRVFPEFLESLFVSQIENLSEQIEITEDEIRLRLVVLGQYDNKSGTLSEADAAAAKYLDSAAAVGGTGGLGKFVFVTNSLTGKLGTDDIRKLLRQARADIPDSELSQVLKSIPKVFTNIQNQISKATRAVGNFDVLQRVATANERRFAEAGSSQATTWYQKFRKRLETKTGHPAPTIRDLLSVERSSGLNARSQVDILNLNNQLAQLVSDRQGMLIAMANAVKNLSAGHELDSTGKGSSPALFPTLNRSSQIPSVLEHMIESEDADDLGPGSGARYVIKERQIISLQITEAPPPYTIAEVNGLYGEGFVPGPQGLAVGAGSNGGNAVASAFAADYDMWRMYGFRGAQPISAPFLSDPDVQCAPFAVWKLNLARKNILQGNLTIAGNEFMQAGEVIYIEDRDLLFYVDSVSHNFNYKSGQFTTSLKLSYGHNPGEYIPTILDIVGNLIYTKRNVANQYNNTRHGRSDGSAHVTSLIFDNRASDFGELEELLPMAGAAGEELISGSHGEQNRRNLINILIQASGVLNTTNRGKKATIELRLYSHPGLGVSVHTEIGSDLLRVATAAKEWLTDPQRRSLIDNKSTKPEDFGGFIIQKDRVKIVDVNFSGDTALSPSGEAWSIARSMAFNRAMATHEVDEKNKSKPAPEELFILNNIIDVWITFEDRDQTLDSSKKPAGVNEFEQEALEQLRENITVSLESLGSSGDES